MKVLEDEQECLQWVWKQEDQNCQESCKAKGRWWLIIQGCHPSINITLHLLSCTGVCLGLPWKEKRLEWSQCASKQSIHVRQKWLY
jgi:hypothetical protein